MEGIRDVLEDDLEHLHQTSTKITSCVSRMKKNDQQAFVHSKIQAKHNNIEVYERVQNSKKNQEIKMELESTVRAAKTKSERENSSVESSLKFAKMT